MRKLSKDEKARLKRRRIERASSLKKTKESIERERASQHQTDLFGKSVPYYRLKEWKK